MADTIRKLKRLIDDEEKAENKIAEWQAILETTRALRKKEEDSEIIRSIRSLKLGPRELYELLVGIQKGTVSMETRQKILDAIEEETAGEGGDKGTGREDETAGCDEGESPVDNDEAEDGTEDVPEMEEDNDAV